MSLFNKKEKKIRPTDRQKNFLSKGEASLNWYLNNDQKIQKWIWRILMIGLGVWILVVAIIGSVKGIIYYQQNMPKENANVAPAIIIAIVTAAITAIETIIWVALLKPFLHILNSATVFFKSLGGQGVIYAVVKDKSVGAIAGIFFGTALVIFIIAIAIRGIRLATARDVEKQEGIRRNTSLSIFGAVVGLFLMTACFVFAIGLVSFMSNWIIEATSGGTVDIGVFVLNYSQWSGVGHATTIPAVWVGTHSGLAMTLLGVAAAAFLLKFIIGAISAIFKIIVLFITSFIALGKWPQDEGGSFMGHKDDLIGVFFNYILLFLLFNLFMILISAISPVAEQFPTTNNFLMPAVVGASLFAAGSVAMTSLTKRLPELFSLKREVGATISQGENVSSTYKQAGNTARRSIDQKGNMISRQVQMQQMRKMVLPKAPAGKTIENAAK